MVTRPMTFARGFRRSDLVLLGLVAISLLVGRSAAGLGRRYAFSEDADSEILSIGWAGGSVESRRFSLYGDGRLVGRVSLPGRPAVKEPVEIVLSREQARTILDTVVDAGLVEFHPGDADKRMGRRLNIIDDGSSLILQVSLVSYDGPGRKEAKPFVHYTGVDNPNHEVRRYREAKLAGRIAESGPDTFVEAEALLSLYSKLDQLVYPGGDGR